MQRQCSINQGQIQAKYGSYMISADMSHILFISVIYFIVYENIYKTNV